MRCIWCAALRCMCFRDRRGAFEPAEEGPSRPGSLSLLDKKRLQQNFARTRLHTHTRTSPAPKVCQRCSLRTHQGQREAYNRACGSVTRYFGAFLGKIPGSVLVPMVTIAPILSMTNRGTTSVVYDHVAQQNDGTTPRTRHVCVAPGHRYRSEGKTIPQKWSPVSLPVSSATPLYGTPLAV